MKLTERLSADYDRLAQYWDSYNPNSGKSTAFYSELFAGLGAKRVLDIGGGTGRHAISLKQSGIEAAICDLSEGMIAQARKNAVQAGVNPDIRIANWYKLQDAYGAAGFDGVMQTLNSIALNNTADKLARQLSSVAYVLKEGGHFAFDIRNFASLNLSESGDTTSIVDTEHFEVKVQLIGSRPEGRRVAFLIMHKPTGYKSVQQARIWTPEQLVDTLKDAGFSRIRQYYDFDIETEHTDTERTLESVNYIQFVAQRQMQI